MLELIQPSIEQQEFIRKSLNEDINTRQQNLEIIKEWLRQQPHLPDTWDDDRIMTFLRGCKFSLEKTKRKLDMYFTIRGAVPEFFSNRDLRRPELHEIINLMGAAVMPGLTKDANRVLIAGATSLDFQTPDISSFFKIVFMISDIRLKMEQVGVLGDVYVLDASVVLLKYLINVSPTIVKKFVIFIQEAYPVKVKEVHVINATPLVDVVLKWVSPFLKEKIRKRIHIHQDLNSLYEYVPKELLPEEFGGTAGKVKTYVNEWVKLLEEQTEWFKEEENIKADETKRPGKPTSQEELFGLSGSFKQLAID